MAQVKEGVSLTHAYKHYKEKRKARKEKAVGKSEFRKVMYSFNQRVVAKALEGFHVQLPHNMGFIRIVGKKSDIKAIDFKSTKELGMTIYHDNRHTDGYRFEWHWSKPYHLVKNMLHYSFIPTNGNQGNSMKERLHKILLIPDRYKRFTLYDK
jgi:hypothetical protein